MAKTIGKMRAVRANPAPDLTISVRSELAQHASSDLAE